MIAEPIKDVKNFMSHLLIKNTFDSFLVSEVSITTFNTFTIDGHINKDFFSDDELENLNDIHMSKWQELRPYCLSIIKGTKTPLKFKFIFALNRKQIAELISMTDTTITENDVNELFINIKYEAGNLNAITGCSLKIFTMDKSLEKAFDSYISKFITQISGIQ